MMKFTIVAIVTVAFLLVPGDCSPYYQIQHITQAITDALLSVLKEVSLIKDSVIPAVKDCHELFTKGVRDDGIYVLNADTRYPLSVYCMFDDVSGWTVIQQRIDDLVNFTQNWMRYRNGFGDVNPDGSYWLGNQHIYKMTEQKMYEIRFDFVDINEVQVYADFESFSLTDEADNYRLHIGAFTGGEAGDGNMDYHNNQMFSTYDSDNDNYNGECAVLNPSGWWMKSCLLSDVNLPYGHDSQFDYVKEIQWDTYQKVIRTAHMMMRPTAL